MSQLTLSLARSANQNENKELVKKDRLARLSLLSGEGPALADDSRPDRLLRKLIGDAAQINKNEMPPDGLVGGN